MEAILYNSKANAASFNEVVLGQKTALLSYQHKHTTKFSYDMAEKKHY
jgi:hypothetical protein